MALQCDKFITGCFGVLTEIKVRCWHCCFGVLTEMKVRCWHCWSSCSHENPALFSSPEQGFVSAHSESHWLGPRGHWGSVSQGTLQLQEFCLELQNFLLLLASLPIISLYNFTGTVNKLFPHCLTKQWRKHQFYTSARAGNHAQDHCCFLIIPSTWTNINQN